MRMKDLQARQREMRERNQNTRISQQLAEPEIPVANDRSARRAREMPINYEFRDVISKLKLAQNGIEDALQLMQSLVERPAAQKENRQKEAPQPPSSAVINDSGGLLDIKAAAKYLGMSPNFVRRIYRNNIPYIILGTGEKRLSIRFRRCDLDVWILKHRIGQK